MWQRQRPPRYEDFEIAIVCTDSLYFEAVTDSFDEFLHLDGDADGAAQDDMVIKPGRIGEHNVVLALLNHVGKAGEVPEADIWSKCTALKLAILTGSCGGVPFINNGQDEVFLGDVITDDLPFHYNIIDNEALLEIRQSRRGPKQLIENFRNFSMIYRTQGGRDDLQEITYDYLSGSPKRDMKPKGENLYPRSIEDKLFDPSYRHKHRGPATCICSNCHGTNDPVCEEALDASCHDLGCDDNCTIVRKRKQAMGKRGHKPAIHFGSIASIDTAMKSGEDRDRFSKAKRVIAFETEGVWRWERLLCIMVKGVRDYADGHINNGRDQRGFAAATAASAIKALLESYRRTIPRENFLVPIQRNPNFTGREDVLRELLAKIHPDANTDGWYRGAITGQEGIGKTQIALEAVHRLHEDHPDCFIFWVSAKDAITFENDYYEIGKQIKIEGIDKDEADVKQLVKSALSEEKCGLWVLVIDGADDLELLGLSSYLPFSRNGFVLFTVRTLEALGLHISEQYVFPLNVANRRGALSLSGAIEESKSRFRYTRHTKSPNPYLGKPTSSYEKGSDWRKAEERDVGSMKVQPGKWSSPVVPVVDDNRSQSSNGNTNEGIIMLFLAEQPRFKALCKKALGEMDRDDFVEIMSRLLTLFHIWLVEEAKSEAEKAVAGLLQSKRDRQRISEQLAAYIDLSPEEVLDIDQRALPCSFSFFSELQRFLLASKAFQSLQVQFALMFLSAELGDVLQSIPKENIWLSQEQDVSISNQFKTLVENTTKVKWNWWPLSQRKRVLNLGESRLFWQCTCGVERWEEISREQRELVKTILEWSDNHPSLTSRCGVRKAQATPFSSIRGILQYAGEQVTRPSRAATRYTPQETSSLTPLESVQLQPLAGAVPPQQQQGPTIGQQAQVTIPDPNNSLQWWILFGVRGARRTLVPTQIHVTNQTTDSHIFQELKRCYMIYRGRLRLWLSVWRLDYCEVVKFSRLTPDRMVREYRELPSDKDYHYDPRAGERDVRNPPISPHHFQTLFYACQSPCTWPFPHDCIPLVANTVNLARIPKRTREFEKDQGSPIWGFETVFAVSFSYVLAYHLVMVAGPFIFWGLWMKFHTDDLQNASVPITVVIGALSLFWSGAGILTSRERE
ncbi:hypothetical protein N5P37_004023 [Trichoderma harzianum]|nr:hypothetical protein N5P37_004023 [Trichoderma harzianum]